MKGKRTGQEVCSSGRQGTHQPGQKERKKAASALSIEFSNAQNIRYWERQVAAFGPLLGATIARPLLNVTVETAS